MDKFKDNRDKDMQSPPSHGEGMKNQDFIGIEPDSSRNEEYAAEITADDYEQRRDEGDGAISTYGWIAIALSAISFFMWPIVLGAAGIILGFVSRSKGADSLGNIAIAAGAISILITLFIVPFV